MVAFPSSWLADKDDAMNLGAIIAPIKFVRFVGRFVLREVRFSWHCSVTGFYFMLHTSWLALVSGRVHVIRFHASVPMELLKVASRGVADAVSCGNSGSLIQSMSTCVHLS